MRKGMKFSNGADFTSEDVAFWWNDVMNNTDLTPSLSLNFRAGHKPTGNPPTFEVIDDYTFKFTFDQPYGGWTGLMTYGAGLGNITDSEYLKQIHVNYADAAELAAKVEEQGFEEGEWYRLWGYYLNSNQQHVTGLPTYGPWILTEMSETSATMERNPYYWKVDEWGQQLPYIDTVEIKIVQDVDAAAVEIIAGNVDMARRPVNPANLPLYTQYADEKGYKVYIQDQHASLGEVFLNITYNDAIWREFVGNVEFRKALAMAIDYEQIIDAVYFGIAEVPKTIAVPGYDPAGAAAILDGLGLTETDADGCRLRSDGQPFTISFEMAEFTGEEIPVGEMVAKFWKDIGICTTVKQIETNLFLTKTGANESQAFTWWAHYPRWPFHENGDYIGQAWQQTYAPLWMRWYDWNLAGGKEAAANPDETDELVVGIEPPQAYLDLRDKQNQLFATSNPNTQKQLWDEMRQIISDNLFWIPIVDPVKGPLIVNANLGNVSETGYAIENAAAAEWYFYKN
jgi:peptide/nickel transport system substrate-binding protein